MKLISTLDQNKIDAITVSCWPNGRIISDPGDEQMFIIELPGLDKIYKTINKLAALGVDAKDIKSHMNKHTSIQFLP